MLGSRGIDNIQTSDARGNKEWHRNNLAQYMVHILYVYVFICACVRVCVNVGYILARFLYGKLIVLYDKSQPHKTGKFSSLISIPL